MQHVDDVLLLGAVEHRRRDRNAGAQIFRQFHQVRLRRVSRQTFVIAIDVLQLAAQRLVFAVALDLVQHVADLAAEAGAGPAQMGFQNLADVHAAGHAQRIEHDVDRGAVFQMRHVLDRQDAADHALVAVTAGHLVARLQLALHRDEHLDHLHHARRQLVAAAQLLDLVGEALVEALLAVVILLAQAFDLAHRLLVAQADLPPLMARDGVEHRSG